MALPVSRVAWLCHPHPVFVWRPEACERATLSSEPPNLNLSHTTVSHVHSSLALGRCATVLTYQGGTGRWRNQFVRRCARRPFRALRVCSRLARADCRTAGWSGVPGRRLLPLLHLARLCPRDPAAPRRLDTRHRTRKVFVRRPHPLAAGRCQQAVARFAGGITGVCGDVGELFELEARPPELFPLNCSGAILVHLKGLGRGVANV